jgi:tripartite-type tricarboxylate transporter receptor subunit TctC
LAVTTADRTPALPEVPTVRESGLPEYEATAWFGLQAPRGTPAAIIERLNADTQAIGNDPAVRAKAESVGARIRVGSIADFADFCAAESTKWAEVIRRSGAKVE